MPTAKDVIRNTMTTADNIMGAYLGDLTDADLLAPPAEGLNPIAWQLGHLLGAEKMFIDKLKPGASPALPEGFAEAHSKEAALPHAFKAFCTKDEYHRLGRAQRAATLAVLDGLSDEQLDGPSGVEFAPTALALLNMLGIHPLMHVGQFVALRRKLGKPVVM